jgi:thioredoxin reductase (NADPH)
MASVRQAERMQRQGKCDIRTFWEVKAIDGGEVVERVTLRNAKSSVEETFAIDAVIPQLGFHSDLGAIREWGLETEKADIKARRWPTVSR